MYFADTMCLPRCQVFGAIIFPNERRKIYHSVCSVTVLELGFGLNRPNGMQTKRQVAFIICSYFFTIWNPRCNSPSNRHHAAGCVYYTSDWSAKNISHIFWKNIQMYLNQGPCICCLQTTKAQHSTQSYWLHTTGCSNKNITFSRRHFLQQTIHVFVYGSSTSPNVRTT